MASKNTKRSGTKTAVEIGAGVLAMAAAAGAGYYFYGDKNAKKHRAAATKWAKDMKKDVVREAQGLKKLDQKSVASIVDRAAAVYQGVRSVDSKDLRAAANELKKNWRTVQSEVSAPVKRAPAKKAAKKAAPRKAAAKKSPAKKSTKRAS